MRTAVFFFLAVAAVTASAQAQRLPSRSDAGQKLRAFVVEEVTNNQSSFTLKIVPNKADGVYYEDDRLSFNVRTSKPCYLYLLDYDSQGNINVLLPNSYQQDNHLVETAEVTVPAPGSNFEWRPTAPFGDEIVQVIATLKPIDLFPGKSLRKARTTKVTLAELKAAVRRAKGFQVEPVDPKTDPQQNPTQTDPTQGPGPNPSDWAEGKFQFKTVAGARPQK